MKILPLVIVATVATTSAIGETKIFKDSIQVAVSEVNIYASAKDDHTMSAHAVAQSEIILNGKGSEPTTMNQITATVPNLNMPDYGSSLTSAIYIRGIGSRINTPAVGLYIDDVPVIDKTGFTFNFVDVAKIDVKRGPQGAVYGRNAMGGVVAIHTRTPFHDSGTRIRLDVVKESKDFSAYVSHNHKLNNTAAFSVAGFYNTKEGFYKNAYLNNSIDDKKAVGGRIRTVFMPKDNLLIDISANYQHTDEGGYAYEYRGKTTDAIADPMPIGTISSNKAPRYWRALGFGGAKVQHVGERNIITSITGFNLINDEMGIDQDFLPTDTFRLCQAQRQRTVTEEVVVKSQGFSKWQYMCGLFLYYQWLETTSNVTFYQGGINMINASMQAAMKAAGSPVSVTLTDDGMETPGWYDTPSLGMAIYHFSTYDISDHLSAQAGFRLDYERNKIEYRSTSTDIEYDMIWNGVEVQSAMPGADYKGETTNDYVNFLPKISLTWHSPKGYSIYANVASGYRSGGYNIQMFSDIVSASFRQHNADFNDDDISNIITYKPEHSINYEIGAHLRANEHFSLDLATFLTNTTDQQVAQFVESGLGRRVVNAGKSRSIGAEASLMLNVIQNRLAVAMNYGFTDARFTDYITYENDAYVCYDDNRVPFIPQQTIGANVDGIVVSKEMFSMTIGMSINALGNTYWTEDNHCKQNAYAQLGAHAEIKYKTLNFSIFGRNITDTQADTFYFESLNHKFAQSCKPRHFGISVGYKF
ncbi:MAG: TonB-dependent receptor [Bacteroidales bacterium]|jgi:outer membrane receptor protein involved in Fe transport|nr:TonB-dependent receptor [Bacteroidales bacterium]